MGRPKIKIIDDSQPAAEIKVQKSKVKTAENIKRAKPETTAEPEVRGDGEKGFPARSRSERLVSEDARRDIEPAGPRTSQKTQKPGKAGLAARTKRAKPRSKKYQEAAKELDRSKLYNLTKAVDMAKKMSYSKINATLEAHVNTTQMGIAGYVSLPYAKGVQLRILVFGPSNPQLEGVVFGADSTIEEISKGKIDFDLVITTPDWMPKLAKVARILGPRGLMPNPKNGTIVPSANGLKKAVESFQAGKTEYKTEPKAPVIHIVMGKLDQPTEELVANIKVLLQILGKTRVKKLTLSPTMGPGIKVDLGTI